MSKPKVLEIEENMLKLVKKIVLEEQTTWNF